MTYELFLNEEWKIGNEEGRRRNAAVGEEASDYSRTAREGAREGGWREREREEMRCAIKDKVHMNLDRADGKKGKKGVLRNWIGLHCKHAREEIRSTLQTE